MSFGLAKLNMTVAHVICWALPLGVPELLKVPDLLRQKEVEKDAIRQAVSGGRAPWAFKVELLNPEGPSKQIQIQRY